MRRLISIAGAVIVASTALPLVHAEQTAPAPPPRANPVIKLLEQGKPAFSIWGNYIGVGRDYHAAVTLQNNKNFDFIIYDLEHDPLDVAGLSQFLRALLDPAAIAREGVSVTKPVIVRIPPNGREIHHNQWMVKQILDTGVAGLMFPHIETAEQAINAIKAVRYPQPAGAPNVRAGGAARRQQRDRRPLLGHERPRVRAALRRVGPAAGSRHADPAHHREQARRRERPRHRPHAEGRQHQGRAVGRRR